MGKECSYKRVTVSWQTKGIRESKVIWNSYRLNINLLFFIQPSIQTRIVCQGVSPSMLYRTTSKKCDRSYLLLYVYPIDSADLLA